MCKLIMLYLAIVCYRVLPYDTLSLCYLPTELGRDMAMLGLIHSAAAVAAAVDAAVAAGVDRNDPTLITTSSLNSHKMNPR